MPVPPRERKPALAALAVLLIVGGALAAAYLVMASGSRISVIRVAEPVAVGQRVPANALEEVRVSATDGLDYIPWADRAKVTRTYAAVTLVRGALLTNGMISRTDEASRTSVVVGLALKPGQLPAGGLQPGDRVVVYSVGGDGKGASQAGEVLTPSAVVTEVVEPDQGDLNSGQVRVSVSVPADDAPRVTRSASAGAVAVALLPPGAKAPKNGGGSRTGGGRNKRKSTAAPGGTSASGGTPTGSSGRSSSEPTTRGRGGATGRSPGTYGGNTG